jgi:glycosyltransferase involved in cell wall biosynthesis
MRRDQRRIGLVIGALGYGGAEGQLYELARALREREQLFVYCLSSRTEPYGPMLQKLGVALRVLPARANFDARRVLALARAMRDDRLDIAHAFLYIATAYAYLALVVSPGVRLVSSARNCKAEPNTLRRVIMRRAFRKSRAVICNSREMARFAVDYYRAPAGRVHVVYNGVDTTRFAARHASAPRPGNGPVIGTVGRVERQKNLDVFLAAAACVRSTACGARFEIVGEGTERRRLEERSRSMSLSEAVRFRGTTDDVPGFLNGLDQFWLTSDWEGTPNVVLEAMAAGVPVIATRVGGTGEVIEDGRTGILVGRGDAGAICTASLALARDAGRAAAIGRSARAAACERFSLERMAADTVAVYDAVVEQRP